jgi:membrane-associated protease RseP (regulator of RpoE activity)
MPDIDFLPVIDFPRRVSNPSVRVWLKHLLWFLLTFVTTTLTGVLPLLSLGDALEAQLPEPQTWIESIQQITLLPGLYFQTIGKLILFLSSHPAALFDGLSYSVPLLFILICHEFGHYIACRIYRIDASLPYFLPSPPLVGVGTFGAFIRIREPLPSRRAVFDIGVAGPLAGFIALIPVAIIGVYFTEPMPPDFKAGLVFNDPLLLRLIAWLMHVDLANSVAGPFYFAAWLGLMVTSLNLIPAGQLDGGHAVYAVFGKYLHGIIAKIAFVVMVLLTGLGIAFYNSPSGLLFLIILMIMLRIGHPEPYDDAPLDMKRRMVAAFTLLVFILSFVPFPIQINLN